MLIRQLLENKKGVKAVKYNKKPKAHTPAEERKVIGPDTPKKKEKVIEQDITRRVTPNADGSFPDPSINRLTGKPNPPAAEPAPSNVKSGGATVEYSGKTYDVMVFGDKSIRPRISGSDTVVSAKVYTKGNKMFVMLDAPAQESVAEGRDGNNVEEFLHKVARSGDNGYDMLYNAQQGKYGREIEQAIQDMYDDISIDTGYHGDDDFEQIYDRMLDNIEADYGQQGMAEGEDDDISWMTPQQQQEFRSAWEFSKSHPKIWRQYQHYDKLDLEDEFPNKSDQELDILINYILNGLDHGDPNRIMGIGRAVRTIFQWKQEGKQGVEEAGMYRQSGSRSAYDRDERASKQGFDRPERDMSDESNLLYIYKNDRVMKRMVSNTVEREARAEGFRDTPEQALKMHGIIRSKFKPGKWVQKQGDQWMEVFPFGKPDDIAETATPGATSAGNVATLGMNPKLSPGPARGKKSYTGTPGKSGTKAPPQPKVMQPKTKHGTAVNALDMKSNIFGGGKAIKRK